MLQASASTARRWWVTNPAKGTVVARITPTTKTTLPSPSQPCLASEPSAIYYLLKGSWPSQCPSWMRTPTMMATMVDCNEHMRSPKRQPTLWPMWITASMIVKAWDASNEIDRGHGNNVDDTTIISYCHIVRSNDNNKQVRGKIKQTPTQIALAKLIPMEQWQCRSMQQQYWSAKLTILSFATIRLSHCRWALKVSTADNK